MNDRQTIALTAGREIRERLRSRAWRASLAVQIAIVLLIVVISAISGGDDSTSYEVGASGPEAVALVNGLQSQTIRDVTVATKEVDDEAAARADVADGELDAAVIDGELVIGPDTDDELIGLLQASAQRDRSERTLQDAGLEEEQIRHALDPAGLPVTEVGADSASAEGIAFIGSLLLYLGILGSGYLVTSGVVEEKSSASSSCCSRRSDPSICSPAKWSASACSAWLSSCSRSSSESVPRSYRDRSTSPPRPVRPSA